MAQKLGFFDQWFRGEWADRDAINANAEALESVEAHVSDLKAMVKRQSEEILRLRAMILGLVNVMQTVAPFSDGELERAVNEAWTALQPPPPPPKLKANPNQTDPYRGLPAAGDPAHEDIESAKKLLKLAEEHHFAKRFAEARAVYEEIVSRYGNTKQAGVARQQLVNLR
jgi:hypothetical protein